MGSIKNLAFAIASTNYGLASAASTIWLRRRVRNRRPLLVYQMGKVGSTSIVDTLKPLLPDWYVSHLHRLSDVGIRDEDLFYYGRKPSFLSRSALPEARHLFEGKFFRQAIRNGVVDTNGMRIITLTREPIGREVSAFFQTSLRDPDTQRRLSDPSLLPGVIDQFQKSNELSYALDWFDVELKGVFGFDIYAHPFPREKGYAIYEHRGISILAIRLESLDSCYRDALKEFLDIDFPVLKRSNFAVSKGYADARRTFNDSLSFSSKFLDLVYASKYATHFYTETEIDEFKRRWLRSTPPS